MDCTCNCFGVATAARVPVKRYNLLVPDVFPVVEPPFDKPLGLSIERKIKKLAEYLEKNEFRAPKASRRLQRRLYKELHAGHYGYVKLAVEAYAHLLAHNKPEKSSLLANELVVQTVVKRRRFVVAGPQHLVPYKEPHLGSAVGLLLTHQRPEIRLLGVNLLTLFTKCQQTSDFVPQLEAFVPLLCDNASPRDEAAAQAASAAAAAAGDAAAGARAAIDADHWASLRAGCLRALLEHLRFCSRLSYVSYHLHTITFTVLECVDASGHRAPQGVYTSPRAMLEESGGAGSPGGTVRMLDASHSITRGSISHAVAASPPDVAALLVFEELAHMTRDAAEGKKVLEFVMRFLDVRRRWLGSPVLETSVAVLQAAADQEHQRYLLFSSLMRHVAAAEALSPAERAAVLQLAVEESRGLEQALAAPALLLALRELPAVMASHGGAGGEVPPMPPHQQQGTAPAGQQEVELAPIATGRPAPLVVPAAAPGGSLSLQPLVLGAVEQLARRVEDSSQLVEAVGSTISKLRGAAPISTAALQCCVAAAQAMQYTAPKTARGPSSAPRTFPSLLLHELAGIAAGWEAQQRLLAHQLFLQLLPAAADGLREQQTSLLLSAVWYEAALPTNRPAAYVAMERTLRALLAAAPAAALPHVLRMAGSLQAEVLLAASVGSAADDSRAAAAAGVGRSGDADAAGLDGGRLGQLCAAQCCALLCLCSSVLDALAAQQGQQPLQQLAVQGCAAPLQHLTLQPGQGLVLHGLPDGATSGLAAERHQFWQSPAASLAFTPEEQQRAAAFLASWRRGTSAEQQQAALAAALAAVPLFKQAGGAGAGAVLFKPLPLSSLAPRLMQAGGSAAANGSVASADGSSRRVQRLRSMYRHMRQISLCDTDRIALATISQESAAEEPAVATLHMRGLVLPWLNGAANGAAAAAADGASPTAAAKSVDDVLSEVDAALDAAEEAMKRGRGGSPVAWRSVAGGSSGSLAGGVDGGAQLQTLVGAT